jgi:hypothetical protein
MPRQAWKANNYPGRGRTDGSSKEEPLEKLRRARSGPSRGIKRDGEPQQRAPLAVNLAIAPPEEIPGEGRHTEGKQS